MNKPHSNEVIAAHVANFDRLEDESTNFSVTELRRDSGTVPSIEPLADFGSRAPYPRSLYPWPLKGGFSRTYVQSPPKSYAIDSVFLRELIANLRLSGH